MMKPAVKAGVKPKDKTQLASNALKAQARATALKAAAASAAPKVKKAAPAVADVEKPIPVLIKDMTSKHLTLSGPGLKWSILNQKSLVNIHFASRDPKEDNQEEAEAMTYLLKKKMIHVVIRGSQKIEPEIADRGGGVLSVTFVAKQSGKYHIDLLLQSSTGARDHATGSPFGFQVITDKTNATRLAVAYGPCLYGTGVGQTSFFCIQAPYAPKKYNMQVGSHGASGDFESIEDAGLVFSQSNIKGGDGQAKIEYSIQRSGEFVLQVTSEDDKHVYGSPFKLNVNYGKIEPGKCYLIPGKTIASVTKPGEHVHCQCGLDTESFVIVQECDQYSNLREDVSAHVTAKFVGDNGQESDLLVTSTMNTDTNELDVLGKGQHKIAFKSSETGWHTIEVSVNSVHMGSYPVEVIATAACGSKSAIEGMQRDLTVGDEQIITLFGRNEKGQMPCFGGIENFKICAVGPAPCPILTQVGSAGAFTIHMTTTKSGPYKLQVECKEDGIQVPGTANMYFHPGPAVSEHTTCKASYQALTDAEAVEEVEGVHGEDGLSFATPRGGTKLAFKAGDSLLVRMHAKDKWHNPLTKGGDTFTVTLESSVNEEHFPVVDAGDGTYSSSVKITGTGVCNIHVSLGGTPIKDSPIRVVVGTANPKADYCTLQGDGLYGAVCGAATTFSINIKDMFGNPNVDPKDIERVSVQISGLSADSKALDEAEKSAAKENKKAAAAKGRSKTPVKEIVKSTKKPSTPHPNGKTISSKGIQPPLNSIETYDSHAGDFYQPKAGRKGQVSAEVGGNNGDGQYVVSFVPKFSGEYTIDVMYNKTPIQGSPYSIKVIPAASEPSWSFAFGPGVKSAVAGVEGVFWIQTRDGFGNMTVSEADDVTAYNATFQGPVSEAGEGESEEELMVPGKVSQWKAMPGLYMVSYTLVKSGDYKVHIRTSAGEAIQDVVGTLKVKPADTVAKECGVEGVGLTNGLVMKERKFTIVGRDQFGNRQQSGGDTFKVSVQGLQKVQGHVVDNSDGTYTVGYSVSVTGTYSIFVYLKTTLIGKMPVKLQMTSIMDSFGEDHNKSVLQRKALMGLQRFFTREDLAIARTPRPIDNINTAISDESPDALEAAITAAEAATGKLVVPEDKLNAAKQKLKEWHENMAAAAAAAQSTAMVAATETSDAPASDEAEAPAGDEAKAPASDDMMLHEMPPMEHTPREGELWEPLSHRSEHQEPEI